MSKQERSSKSDTIDIDRKLATYLNIDEANETGNLTLIERTRELLGAIDKNDEALIALLHGRIETIDTTIVAGRLLRNPAAPTPFIMGLHKMLVDAVDDKTIREIKSGIDTKAKSAKALLVEIGADLEKDKSVSIDTTFALLQLRDDLESVRRLMAAHTAACLRLEPKQDNPGYMDLVRHEVRDVIDEIEKGLKPLATTLKSAVQKSSKPIPLEFLKIASMFRRSEKISPEMTFEDALDQRTGSEFVLYSLEALDTDDYKVTDAYCQLAKGDSEEEGAPKDPARLELFWRGALEASISHGSISKDEDDWQMEPQSHRDFLEVTVAWAALRIRELNHENPVDIITDNPWWLDFAEGSMIEK